jgi:hypothetical protein
VAVKVAPEPSRIFKVSRGLEDDGTRTDFADMYDL